MKNIFKIKLDIKDVPGFIMAANSISSDINLTQNNKVVSGKSIMGVFSLDLSAPMNLIVRDREDDSLVNEKFGKWIAE